MSAPASGEIFSLDEEENAGIAALCRGFLTTYSGKSTPLPRDAHELVAPD
ncbi:MAG: hypothetical protein VB133_10805 [Anaeromusa sp.]|nr:hypothetical protein [Anaeromusa sp.]MEA4835611.1 hypothetical protein [Anaeromusa sp.]